LRRFGFAAAGIISGLIYGEAADWGANFLYGHKSDLSALIMSKRELLAPKLNASSANSFVSKTSSLTIDALADYEDIKQVVSGMPDSQLWKTLQDLQPVEVRNTAQQTENIYLPRNLQILGPNMENSKELVVAIMGDIYFTSVQGLRKLYENKTKVIGAADADGMTITRLSCVLTFDQIDKWAKIYDSDEASPTPQPVAPQPNGVIEDNGQCRPRRTTAPAARAQPN